MLASKIRKLQSRLTCATKEQQTLAGWILGKHPGDGPEKADYDSYTRVGTL